MKIDATESEIIEHIAELLGNNPKDAAQVIVNLVVKFLEAKDGKPADPNGVAVVSMATAAIVSVITPAKLGLVLDEIETKRAATH